MGEIVKIKHLLWTIASLLVYSFVFGMNVNSKLNKVDNNESDVVELKQNYKDMNSLIIKNHDAVIDGMHAIELQLKDKKDREP